jgi:hypothetical protein
VAVEVDDGALWWHDRSQVHSAKPKFGRPKQQSAGQRVELILRKLEYLRVVFLFECNINRVGCMYSQLKLRLPTALNGLRCEPLC